MWDLKKKYEKMWADGSFKGPEYYRWDGPESITFPGIQREHTIKTVIPLLFDGLEEPGAFGAALWRGPSALDPHSFRTNTAVIVYLDGDGRYVYGTTEEQSLAGLALNGLVLNVLGEFDADQAALRTGHNPGLPTHPGRPE